MKKLGTVVLRRMSVYTTLATWLVTTTCALAQSAPTSLGRQEAKTFISHGQKTNTLAYLLYLPKAYDAEPATRWPLTLFLHGSGERGTNIAVVTKHGPPRLVREGHDLPFILISPQCPDKQRWDDTILLGLLDEIEARYRVDTNRVYLTGLSMGGSGTWNLGLKHPQSFAALAPICGSANPELVQKSDSKRMDAIKSLGIWVFHGAKDPTVPITASERMVEALKGAGCKDVQFTKYPEAQHDSWTETYNNPNLYHWLLAHHR